MNKLVRQLLTVLLGGLILLAWVVPVAAINNPDDMEVLGAYVYEDCLEDGDTGVLIYYNIDYAVAPNETANEAFLFVFLDTDGTTQLMATAPYPYVDYGYGYGASWIYFDAATTTAYGLDSGNVALHSILLTGNRSIRLDGSPTDRNRRTGLLANYRRHQYTACHTDSFSRLRAGAGMGNRYDRGHRRR